LELEKRGEGSVFEREREVFLKMRWKCLRKTRGKCLKKRSKEKKKEE
jgi:hypothetical protein